MKKVQWNTRVKQVLIIKEIQSRTKIKNTSPCSHVAYYICSKQLYVYYEQKIL